ncbi:MAG: restriction endonuclease subunit S [Acidobacteriaceae bacterium]
MAFELPMVRIGDYVDACLGKMLDAQKNRGVLHPYLGNSNVRWGTFDLQDLAVMRFEEHEEERYGIQDGDLVVCEGGEPGRCAIWRGEVLAMKIQKALHRLRVKDGLDNYFLYYWFLHAGKTGALEPFFTGTTIKHLTGRALAELRVPLLPIGAQRRLVRILKSLDDKIELNRHMSATLEAMARALFKDWFVDFGPVRAKMEGRWRRGESLPGLPAHLYDLFPDRLVESDLGEIPEGWGVGRLGDIADHPRRGIQPNSIEPDTPYIALEHMPKRCIALSEWSVADGIESNKFEFRKGDILFGKLRPYFHKVGVAPADGVCSTDIVVVVPKNAIWFGFVLGHVSSAEFVEYTNAGSTGTKMPRTRWTDMAHYKIALPPQTIAQAFTQRLRPSVGRIIAGIHESRSLAQLRDTLLPRLISGELRLPEAKAQVVETAA